MSLKKIFEAMDVLAGMQGLNIVWSNVQRARDWLAGQGVDITRLDLSADCEPLIIETTKMLIAEHIERVCKSLEWIVEAVKWQYNQTGIEGNYGAELRETMELLDELQGLQEASKR